MSSHRHVKAVIFDLDDTLIDWSGQSVSWKEFSSPRLENIRRFLQHNGNPMPAEEEFFQIVNGAIQALWERAKETLLIESIGDMLLEVLGKMGIATSTLNLKELLTIYDWQPFPGVRLFSDTTAVLRHIQERNVKIGLVTNSFLPMWMRDVELDAYDILRFMDARLTAADVGFIKPHPQIYQQIVELLEVRPENAIFVGDRPKHDIVGANQAGLISVQYCPPHISYDTNGVIPDYTITSLIQLISILDSLDEHSLAVT